MNGRRHISEVNPFIKLTLGKILRSYFARVFNVDVKIPEEVASLKAPYVILPNHQGFWDPFLIGAYLKNTPYFVTSDAVFRSRLFGFLMRFFGAIPKTKSQSDIDALKNIFEMKDLGRCIGIFSEGQRTWDGCTLPVIKSTAKLVRMLKIPVVTVVFKGGYLAQPRWRKSISRGQLTVEFSLLFREGETASMKASEIHKRITEALAHDEIAYQKKNRIRWVNPRAAEHIEQVLFICPVCGRYDGFESSGSSFRCKSCSSSWYIDEYQEIHAVQGKSRFDNVRDWDHWQQNGLKKYISKHFATDKEVLSDSNLVFKTGYKSRRMKNLTTGSLILKDQAVYILDKNGKEVLKMDIAGISGINVQNHETLDFYYHGTLYTALDPKSGFSAYKWWRAVDFIQREILKLNIPE